MQEGPSQVSFKWPSIMRQEHVLTRARCDGTLTKRKRKKKKKKEEEKKPLLPLSPPCEALFGEHAPMPKQVGSSRALRPGSALAFMLHPMVLVTLSPASPYCRLGIAVVVPKTRGRYNARRNPQRTSYNSKCCLKNSSGGQATLVVLFEVENCH